LSSHASPNLVAAAERSRTSGCRCSVRYAIAVVVPAAAQQVLKWARPRRHPLHVLDTKHNTIRADGDLITEIGKDAGFTVQIEQMQFSAL